MRRKPVNPDAAQAEGVDYLLREFSALRTATPATTGIAAATGSGGRLDPTVTVAASNAEPDNYAAADYQCDGVDDDDELDSALAYVESLGGGIVQLTEGDFYCAGSIDGGLATNRRGIVGMGRGITTLHSQEAPSLGTFFINGQQIAYLAHFTVSVTHTNYSVGINMPSATASNPGVIDDVECTLATGDPGVPIKAFLTDNHTIMRNCSVGAGNAGDGISVSGTHNTIVNCYVAATGAYGASGSDSGYGIYCGASVSAYVTIIGNTIRNTDTYAILVYDDHATIIGNNCEGDTIYIHSTATDAIYGGNQAVIDDNGPSTSSMDNTVLTAADVSPLTTKGDLWGYTTVDARRSVGSDGDHLVSDSGDATGVSWETPNVAASAQLYVSTPAATTIGSSSTPVKVAGTTTLETTPAAVGFTMPSNNRLTYGGTATKKFLVTATITVETAVSAPNQLLGLHLAEGGTVNTHTTIERFVVTEQQKGALAIQGMFELATNEYVEVWISNETAGNNATVDWMTLTAIEVP